MEPYHRAHFTSWIEVADFLKNNSTYSTIHRNLQYVKASLCLSGLKNGMSGPKRPPEARIDVPLSIVLRDGVAILGF